MMSQANTSKLASWCAALMIGAVCAPIFAAAPTIKLASAPLVDPSTAWNSFYVTSTVHTPGVAATAGTPPEIAALARALGAGRYSADVYTRRVFDYVRLNIETEFRFGLGKGARGAVLDQSGTPFDQAALMVALLRAGNVTAGYKVGPLVLNANEFGQWTGLVKDLNQANQTFTVSAKAACTFLADGGIPAFVNTPPLTPCTSVTGNLTTVTLLHAWVTATYDNTVYVLDPSYKRHVLKAGIDLPAAMGCGTAGSPTCGSTLDTQARVGATTNQTVADAPYVLNVNRGNISTRLNAYATSLQTAIQGIDRFAQLEDIASGSIIDRDYSPAIGTSLPYASTQPAAFATWAGDIPDKFRTTLSVQLHGMVSPVLYLDELYGQRLRIATDGPKNTWTRTTKLFLEAQVIATGTATTASGSLDIVTLGMNHPYAANAPGGSSLDGTYADESVPVFAGSDTRNSNWEYVAPGGQTTVELSYSSPITIVASVGRTGHGFQELMTARQATAPYQLIGTFSMAAQLHEPHPSQAAGILVQTTQATRVLEGVTKTKVSAHHTLGAVFSIVMSGTTSGMFNMTAMVSDTSATANTTDRIAAFKTFALLASTLEGSVVQQGEDGHEAVSAPTLLRFANEDHEQFLTVTADNFDTVRPYLASQGYDSTRLNNIDAILAGGYQMVLPHKPAPPCMTLPGGQMCWGPGGEIIYSGTELGYSIMERLKGNASVPQHDPLKGTLQATQLGSYSLRNRNSYAINAGDGTITLTPPADLSVGAGDYPASLAFRRTYSSANTAQNSCVWGFPGGFPSLACERMSNGSFQTTLGNGWHHNLEISAEWANNGAEAFAATSALRASTALATLYALFDLSRADSLLRQVAAVLGMDWMGSTLMKNCFVVHLPEKTLVFAKLPDGSYDAPINEPSARLITNSARGGPTLLSTAIFYDYSPTTVQYRSASGDVMNFSWNSMDLLLIGSVLYGMARPSFDIQDWSTPSGVKVTWTYADYDVNPTLRKRVLMQVSNNLGHALTFNSSTPSDLITRVTDQTGRTVSFATSACSATPYPISQSNAIIMEPGMIKEDCRGNFAVTQADGQVTSYSYLPDSSSPDPADLTYPSLRLRRWFTPQFPSSPYLTVSYDQMLHVATTVDPLGNTSRSYTAVVADEFDRLGEFQDAANGVSRKYHDRFNNPLIEIDANGRTTFHSYDNARRRVKTVLPEGNGFSYTYDVRSNLLTTTQFAANGSPLAPVVTTSTTYMEGPTVATCANLATCNRPFQVKDSLNNTTTYAWNPTTGLLASIQRPAVSYNGFSQNPLTSFGYTTYGSPAFHLLTSKTEFAGLPCQSGCSPVNIVTSYSYNASNKYVLQNVVVDVGGLALTTGFGFNPVGEVVSMTDPRSNPTSYTYDRMRRLTSVSGPLSSLVRYCYNVDGELMSTNRARTSTTDPNASTQTTTGLCPNAYPTSAWQSMARSYFTTGDLRTETDAEGNVTQYAYDPTGRLRVVQDGDGRQSASVYDLGGQLIATWHGGSGWIGANGLPSGTAPTANTQWVPSSYSSTEPLRYGAYAYFANGEKQSDTDANGNTTTYTYDGLNRLTSTVYADTRHEDLWYTVDGTPTGAKCGSASSQPCRKIMRSGNHVNFTYDVLDRLVVRTPQLGGAYTYGYDLRNLLISVSKASGGSLPAHATTYVYDKAKRKTSETNDGRLVQYAYDSNGNRTHLYWPDGYYVQYQYDALNRMTRALQNGSVELAYYDYDTLSRRNYVCLGGQSTSCQGGGGTNKTSYAYEPDSDISTLTQTLNGASVVLTYGHNHSHQITSLNSSDPFYLPVPTGTSNIPYTPQVLNQYSAVGGHAMTYDTNANLKTLFPSTGSQTFTYDIENRLVSAAVNGSSSNSVFYDYDALERRAAKTVGGTAFGAGGTTTIYLSDGQDEIAELNGSSALLRRYIPGPSVDERIAVAEGASTTNPTLTYFHVNHQGSVMALTDAAGNASTPSPCAAGVNCQRLAYDEYGNLSSGTAPTGAAFRFTGRRFDSETGLYYYRARYYSSEFGRFMQLDPIGAKDDLNLYAYVGNAPLNGIDPAGTERIKAEFELAIQMRGGIRPGVAPGPEAAAAARTLRYTVGGGLAVMVAAPVVLQLGWAAFTNPAVASELAVVAGEIGAGEALGAGTLAVAVGVTKVGGQLAEEGGLIFRGGGSNPGNLKVRPGEEAVSFRDSLTNPLPQDGPAVLKPGEPYIVVDPTKLPAGTVKYDGATNGLPPGHVSVTATPEQIKQAIVDKDKFPN